MMGSDRPLGCPLSGPKRVPRAPNCRLKRMHFGRTLTTLEPNISRGNELSLACDLLIFAPSRAENGRQMRRNKTPVYGHSCTPRGNTMPRERASIGSRDDIGAPPLVPKWANARPINARQ